MKWRKFIVRNTLLVTIIAIIISFILPQRFRATTTILPPSPEQSAMIGMISANIPSGLAGLARIGGGLPGVSTASDLFAAIMKSGRIKGVIIKKYDLKKEFKAKTMSDVLKALDGITNLSVSPEGIISVSVTYTNKYLAADIANAYAEELDKFNTESAMTVGKRYRIFIEKRLRGIEDSLTYAENALSDFQKKHRTIAFDIELRSAIETIAKLKSEVILLEVQKGAIRTSSSINNPYVGNINQKLRELKKQLAKIEIGSKVEKRDEFGIGFSVPLSKLPELSLEYARLFRNMKIQEVVYELVTQQYEQAKIMELKDTPTVQILDRAGPPEKRIFPVRRVITLVAFFCTFLLSVLYAFASEYFLSKSNKKVSKRLYELFQIILNDFYQIKVNLKKIFKK